MFLYKISEINLNVMIRLLKSRHIVISLNMISYVLSRVRNAYYSCLSGC